MSFISDFKNIIESDTSLNTLITGDIKFDHLPEDWDITKNWLAWNYRISEQIDTLAENNNFSRYSIAITVTSIDSVVMNNICNVLKNYLNTKQTDKFIDIRFLSESKITTLSRTSNAYQDSLEFEAIYVE